MSLKQLSHLALVAILFCSASLWAQDKEPFTQKRFEQLQQAGELILIDVHATWCPTCAKQGEILEAYQNEHPDRELTILNVDFDDQKKWVKHFKAPRQSTLILYRGEERVWFSVAETDRERIFAALNSAGEPAQ